MMRERASKIHALAGAGLATLILILTACGTQPASSPNMRVETARAPIVTPSPPADASAAPSKAPDQTASFEGAPKRASIPDAPAAADVVFRRASWSDLPGWRDDQVNEAWGAFIGSCPALSAREPWREICAAGQRLTAPDAHTVRQFFERTLTPWKIASGDGSDEGLITGYYEPLLRGSRKPTSRFRYPLYGVPDDLVVVELGDVYPELKGMRLRGKLDGRRVMPYYDRAQIEHGPAPLRGKELVWVDDAVDLFFLHIQGSGRILLDSGDTIRVGYADQNGYPYRSIGRLLVERGDLALAEASMQGIKAWARTNPERLTSLLNSNPSYVFFRELPASGAGPPGSLGVALTPRRSLAVDARHVPLGVPVYIATTWPNSTRPLHRLMLAQDTGGAIRGAVRADYFWGYGEAAAHEAGRMKQRLRMWVLFPQGYSPSTAASFD